MKLSTAMTWKNGKAYFFNGAQYIRYDIAADKADANYPRAIKQNWPGLWESDVDAAVLWTDQKAYFFKGPDYVRYDVAADKVDAGYPKPIAKNWPGLWSSGIDAVLLWNNGKAYFFKDKEYIRYDVKADKADPGYPKLIAGNWPGLPATGMDAALLLNNGKAFFFYGSDYFRYDVKADKVDPGYPKPIAGNWPGLVALSIGVGGNPFLKPQGNGGNGDGIPPDRSVAVQGMIQIQDHELIASNEHSTTEVWSYAALSKLVPVPSKLLQMQAVCGGEIRVELDLEAGIANADHVIVSGSAKFFEGTSDSTGDLEQTKAIHVLLPPGVPTGYNVHLFNQDEEDQDDNADIILTFTNETA